jgi:hypothetical protein
MKKFSGYALLIVALTLACGVITSAAIASPVAPPRSNPGRLIIRRAANLGDGLFLDVNIDGANAATIGMGRTYRGSLSPGKHEISVILRPNQLFLSPTKKTLMVEGGKTYAFTAMWQGQNLVLR